MSQYACGRMYVTLVLLLTFANAQQNPQSCPSAQVSISKPDGLVYSICPGSDFQVPSSLIQSNVTSSTACLDLCDGVSSCRKAVYDHIHSVCHLKGNPSIANWVVNAQYDTISMTGELTVGTVVTSCPVTEVRQTMPDGRVSVICPGTDYTTPSVHIQSSITSSSDCAQLCDQQAGCTRAVYDRVYAVCHLKSQVGTSSWVQDPQYEVIRIDSLKHQETPIMGYNSYNDVACSPTHDLMMSAMQGMSSKGFLALGYNYFQIDCGWQGYDRLLNGSITYDNVSFPDGIKPLSDYASSLGFRWGMYTDQGVYSCDTSYNPHRPGSLGYETQDAAMFAAWNVQYLKVDNCFVDPNDNAPKNALSDFPRRYTAIWDALIEVGIPNMMICQWGVPYLNTSTNTLQGPSSWTTPMSTSFRIADDIAQGWSNVLRIYNQAIHACLLDLVGPGHFADMDLLEVGNPGMTVDEQKSHFAIWATFKSALMISTNIPQMSSQSAAILGNQALIDINQDLLGRPVKLSQRFSNDYDLFVGPLANGDQVLLVIDQSNKSRRLNFSLSDVGISTAVVQDLWTGQNLGSLSSVDQNLPAHGSMVFRLSQARVASQPVRHFQTFNAAAVNLANGSYITSCTTCPDGLKIAGVTAGSGASIVINGIQTSQSTNDVLFDYLNCDVQYLGSSIPNVRTASISVNGQSPVIVLFPLTGYDWNGDQLTNFKVRLSGFSTRATNSITIQAVSGQGDAPDFARIQVPN